MNTPMVADYLRRNGIILERAHRQGRSLSAEERNIIAAGRNIAAEKGLTRQKLNELEMEGERHWEEVFKPIKVRLEFAYFDEPYEDIAPLANYFVRESNHPALPEGSHVCADQILVAGQRLPNTPSYEQWVKKGRKVVRG